MPRNPVHEGTKVLNSRKLGSRGPHAWDFPLSPASELNHQEFKKEPPERAEDSRWRLSEPTVVVCFASLPSLPFPRYP